MKALKRQHRANMVTEDKIVAQIHTHKEELRDESDARSGLTKISARIEIARDETA